MRSLVIVDHPYYDRSVVNRRWLDEVRKYPEEFLVHNLQSSYPRSGIDCAREHTLIENNGTVVFQFPLFWFNSPPMLKSWFDSVLSQGWAFGSSYKLEGRKIAFAVTTGMNQESYTKDGVNQHTVEEFLLPYINSIKYCKANYVGTYVYYGANSESNDLESIISSAKKYIEFLRETATN